MKSPMKALFLALALALVLGAACGGENYGGISLSLEFQPRDLPQGTTTIRYYVLPYDLDDGSQAACEDFMGAQATKSVLDYTLIKYGEQQVSSTEPVTLTVADLEEGTLMFYIEAASTSQVLACGCGQGQVQKGKKVIIPIRLVTDCQ